VFQHGFDLGTRRTGKPFDKLRHRRSAFQIFEESFDGDTCAFEEPDSADLFRGSLDGGTLRPIEQGANASKG
jgi:hypothetical protein